MALPTAAAFVAHQRVLTLPRRQFADVVGEGLIEKGRGPRAADLDLAHVGNVEQAGRLPHSQVLVGNAGVLHRHLPAAELNQFSAQRLVRFK